VQLASAGLSNGFIRFYPTKITTSLPAEPSDYHDAFAFSLTHILIARALWENGVAGGGAVHADRSLEE
jgi:hypothetical protein